MPQAPCYLTRAIAGAAVLALTPAGPVAAQDGFVHAYVHEDCAPGGGRAITIVLAREPWTGRSPPVPHFRATLHRAELQAGQMAWFDKTPFSAAPAGTAVRCEARGCEPVDARLRLTAFEPGRRVEGLLIPSTGPRREQELSLPFTATWRPGRPACD